MGTTLGDLLSSNAYSGVLLDPTSDGLELWDDSEPSGDQSKGITVDQLHRLHPESPMEDEANTFTEPQEINTGSAEAPLELGTDQKEEKVDGLEADLLDNRHDVGFDLNVDDLTALKALEKTDALSFLRTPDSRSGPFIAKDADPFGDGADDAMAVETQNGNWWARQEAVADKVVEARWFGFSESATASQNRAALQSAINRAAQIGAVIVKMPAGFFEIADTVYLSYDSNENTEFPSAGSQQGQIQLVGAGIQSNGLIGQEPFSGPARGTILEFKNSSGPCLEARSSDSSNPIRALQFHNFGLRSNSTDYAFYIEGANTLSGFDRLNVYVIEDSGSGIRWDDTYISSFSKSIIAGNSSTGVGLEIIEEGTSAGGLIDITQVTCGGFDIGLKLGDLGSQSGSPEDIALYSCQFISNRVGVDAQLAATVRSFASWWENNSEKDVFARGFSAFSDFQSMMKRTGSTITLQFGDSSLSTSSYRWARGVLVGTKIGIDSIGVRMEGGNSELGVDCISNNIGESNNAVSNSIGYSTETGLSRSLNVMNPNWSSLPSTPYENRGDFGTIMDEKVGVYRLPNLPTSQPANAGEIWNDGGTLKVS